MLSQDFSVAELFSRRTFQSQDFSVAGLFSRRIFLSKWPEAKPLKTKEGSEILKFFDGLCMRFGFPKVLITDQGREFCNKQMDSFCADNRIDHRVTTAYHPQSNGLTERYNQSIKMGLRKLIEKPSDWPNYLDRVLFGLRTHVPRSTKISPFMMCYGIQPRLAIDNKQSEYIAEEPEISTENADDPDLEKHMEDTLARHTEAHTNIKIEQKKQKRRYDEIYSNNASFKKGDIVMLENSRDVTRKEGTLNHKRFGPYKVVKVTKYNTALLEPYEENVPKQSKNVSFSRLTKFHIRETNDTLITFDDEPRTSWHYNPPTTSWLREKASILGIKRIRRPKFAEAQEFNDEDTSTYSELLKNSVSVQGDGNCFYRALAAVWTGVDTDKTHLIVRQKIAEHIELDAERWSSFVGRDINDYLDHSRRFPAKNALDNSSWGSSTEMLAAAELFNCYIFSYNQNLSTWQCNMPNFVGSSNAFRNRQDRNLPTIMLYFSVDHFTLLTSPK